jgi:DNA ligase-associated metallophosphoesterase
MTHPSAKTFFTTIADQQIELLPSGAVHWPDQRTLVVADLHLGKGTTFRRNGIPVPKGTDEQTLRNLQVALWETKAETLLVLGDLVHASLGWTDILAEQLYRFQKHNPTLNWHLVLGNHDRGSISRLQQFTMLLSEPPLLIGPFVFLHEPPESTGISQTRLSMAKRSPVGPAFYMAGHLHPAVSISNHDRTKIRLKCFWLKASGLILPAFGEFTGRSNCKPSRQDRIIGIVDGELIEVNYSG